MSPADRDASGTRSGAAPFAAVTREPRLPDKVAELLRASIVDGQLRPGDRLPTERELGDQFGVSRTVVREAVRTLVAKGLMEARSGSGVYVASVGESAVRESMNMFLLGAGLPSYAHVHEVRRVLEVEIAGLAAERATDDDVAAMEQTCIEMAAAADNLQRASAADVEFHRALARATGNRLFVVMMDAIGDVLVGIRNATLGTPGRVLSGVDFHRSILGCVVAHDVAGAREAMQVHLDDARTAWLATESEDQSVGF
jgi:GntR family transcriptional regulator, transcriptional repressor for pyruvate dehydrogenase complex